MAEITESKNFIHAFIEEDIAEGGRFAGKTVHTRFPPEPNGYLHIGHCKALIIDFGTAEKFGGLCNLRMDDTNPAKEDTEYVDAIQEDIHWLGFDWDDRFFYGSDYFEKTYELAVALIKKGLAYVCELTPEQFKEYRGDTTTPAQSPWRDRPVEESLELFERMKAVVSMRLHGLIFSAGQGVPLVGIVYDQKVSSFLSYIGQDLYEDLNSLTAETLKDLIDQALERGKDPQFLSESVAKLHQMEAVNRQVVEKYVKKPH